ncbi:MAG TPA: glycine cleavage system aminomethyltransferase GcvT [Syntrophomonadaceae bacterium]|nr:glycine cleavage system aminomethyltransferase GcvT [Syntrophomonadaceae bacterium]
MSLKRTPLYDAHLKHTGKIIDFGGWELPVQYEGIIKEHHMVREKAGLFDVSHMGEFEVTGPHAEEFLQYLVTNDIKNMQDKQIVYTFMCYPDGGVVDDLLVYKYDTDNYLLVVNASNLEKDLEWIEQNVITGVKVNNVSDQFALIAIQGPLAQDILQKIADIDLTTIKQFWFNPAVELSGVECLVSRTGYTGEDGFEIYLKPEKALFIWDEIMRVGGEDITPAGLGARDTLRFEAKLPLYGQEIDKDITPLEAGFGFAVRLNKDDFIGKDVLLKQKNSKLQRTLVEFEMLGKGIPRSHYEIEKDGKKIGWVTSGAHSPTLNKNMGLALINSEFNNPGDIIDIVIRNKRVKAILTKSSFYKRKAKKEKKAIMEG